MDYLSIVKRPIERELEQFNLLFNDSLSSDSELLIDVLQHIRQREGKRMRPILVLLMAKSFGDISLVSQNAALGLELLHTASLIHDDVVDEANIRRGQASVNAIYDNKVSVLVGDFLLATALLKISHTHNDKIVEAFAELGRTLASGELLQLSNIENAEVSEKLYFDIIKKKTAAMFETCATIGALSVNAPNEVVEKVKLFGQNLGMAFQIRDDIFDYFSDQDIGKPTCNDMEEGKLTLPVLFALKNTENSVFFELALKVKRRQASKDDIAQLVNFTKENGGIEYAERHIKYYQSMAMEFVNGTIMQPDIRSSLTAYIAYVLGRRM